MRVSQDITTCYVIKLFYLTLIPSISVGTIIDYNLRLLGCLFHNDLSIMKLVIDNNRKIRHLAAKHETKKWQVVSFLAMKLKLQNTRKGSKSVPKCKKIIGPTNHILVFRYQSKLCMLGMQAGADRKSLFGALSLFLRSVSKRCTCFKFCTLGLYPNYRKSAMN